MRDYVGDYYREDTRCLDCGSYGDPSRMVEVRSEHYVSLTDLEQCPLSTCA